MCWGGVKVIIEFLHILAVIPFMASDTVETFLDDRILAVPERKSKAKALVIIADTSNSILSPPVCARSGMSVRKVGPCVSVMRVVLPDCGLYQP